MPHKCQKRISRIDKKFLKDSFDHSQNCHIVPSVKNGWLSFLEVKIIVWLYISTTISHAILIIPSGNFLFLTFNDLHFNYVKTLNMYFWRGVSELLSKKNSIELCEPYGKIISIKILKKTLSKIIFTLCLVGLKEITTTYGKYTLFQVKYNSMFRLEIKINF